MAEEAQEYLAIGRIVGAHGIHGEVKVELMTDFPERYRAGARVYLGSLTDPKPVEIGAARPHKSMMLVKLAHVPDRNAAELLTDQYLLIPETQAMKLGEHENYLHDLIGLQVVTEGGEAIGKIAEILLTKANDVYVVAGEGREVLVPARRDVVLTVDLTARTMTVCLPDGLLDA